MDKEEAYLLGLITGRGHFFPNSKVIAIEFSHTNGLISGIAHCSLCGYLVTNTRGTTTYKCKNTSCGAVFSEEEITKSVYNQQESTIKSLENSVIPFIKDNLECKFQIIGNRSMTLLLLDFKGNPSKFDQLLVYFDGNLSFDKFHIPDSLESENIEIKTEFINGLLDTAGFNNAGGWLNRDGKHDHGRMRSYFQIVRNWYLPVEIDNFIRKHFGLPLQTIDWGHPNIRDSSMNDYYNSSFTSWSREHQVKFFPEYYKMFSFRIEHKQRMFEELIQHNEHADFGSRTEDWFPPNGGVRPKAYHVGEQDPRLPAEVRKHFDAFWQVNYALGCEYLKDYVNSKDNPDVFYLTGKDVAEDIAQLKEKFHRDSESLADEIHKRYAKKLKEKAVKHPTRTVPAITEEDLYEPIKIYLQSYLHDRHGEEPIVYDTSAHNLNQYLRINDKELLEIFDYCEDYRIKPDVVGFIKSSNNLTFVEVKITNLDLKNLGQLIGYCMVAQPDEAILVSDKPLSSSFVMAVKAVPELLEYNSHKKVKIAQWKDNKLNFIEI